MKRFSIQIAVRIIFLGIFLCPVPFFFSGGNKAIGVIFLMGAIISGFSLYHYSTSVNTKLVRFFESIQYSDFTIKFSSDNKLGKSFQDLNLEMNQVIEAFKSARAEKEANIHFLNTMVQHIDVGIICYDIHGQIEILNNSAIRLLEVYRLRRLDELLKTEHDKLYHEIRELNSGGRFMYHAKNGLQLSVNATKVNLRGRAVKIISLQNIRSELQEKELDAWQNLTKVLRHEIMNSIAPIVSLVGTMRDIVEEDLSGKAIGLEEPINDLSEALKTIESRGKGVMHFVNAYRDFTTLPKPVFVETQASKIMGRIEALALADVKDRNIDISFVVERDFTAALDVDQIEMVLINLVKNAIEAIGGKENGAISVKCFEQNKRRIIEVRDNGSGIVPEALEKIFIPFYTTKKTGQGIGLSLSKQILQMHRGDLTVRSELGKGTAFRLEF
ncbi:MAG: two-component system nitrogen regulation sensor histidine kinase NtrY [Arcticibacterium sp.]|jgi:two-component system nitrogen regulation sensor histidine kinase NtrY